MIDDHRHEPPPDRLHVGGARYPAGPPSQWPAWAPPPPGPAPAPEQPARPGGRRTVGLAAAAAAVVVALIVAAVAWGISSGDDQVADAGPSTSGSTAPVPTAPSIPGFGPSDPGFDPFDPDGDPFDDARPLEEVLPSLIDFVEVTRGHRFETEPVVEALPEADFLERLRSASGGSEEQIRADGVALRALGILPPDADSVRIQEDLGESSVLGFYDPGTEALAVRGSEVTPYVETVIVHELTHALDDQLFDLERGEDLADQDDEAGFGFLALAEGSARRVQLTYEEQLSPDELLSAQIEALSSGLGTSGDPLPEAYGIAVSVPYGNGAQLVDALLAEDGNRSLDAAFRAPPVTSEQVLDPEAYAAQEPALTVPAPKADGPVVAEGAVGAVDLRLLQVVADPGSGSSLLVPSSLISPAVAVEALEGFGGGRYVAWEQGDQACIRFTAVGDSAEGTSTVERILMEWEVSVGAPQGETVELGTGGVTSTRCA